MDVLIPQANLQNIHHNNNPPESDNTNHDHLTKLSPILEMANHYSGMDKSSLDPFVALQGCAAVAKQRVKSVSKASVNSEGHRQVICQVFSNDINLVSIIVTHGTDPDDVKRKLALAVLEKITLPHLRIISNAEVGLILEASRTPFVKDCTAASTTTSTISSLEGVAKGMRVQPKVENDVGYIGVAENSEKNITNGPSEKMPSCDSRLKTSSEPPFSLLSRINKFSQDKDFDSYIAWRCEKNPLLKMVRQLSHMYATLPFKSDSTKPVTIIQVLSNVSGITLEIKKCGRCSCSRYSMLMDKQVILFSFFATTAEKPDHFICTSVLDKISMPYLCLIQNTLQSSSFPFTNRADIGLKNDVILDTWQTEHEREEFKTKYSKPIKWKDFCLFQSINDADGHSFVLKESLSLNKKNLKYFHVVDKDGDGNSIRIGYVKLDSEIIACKTLPLTQIKSKTLNRLCLKLSLINLKKCHWTIRKVLHLKNNNKKLQPVDVLPYNSLKQQQQHQQQQQQPQQKILQAFDSSSKGHQLLKKMGWNGGAIGQRDGGIIEPIAVKVLAKNSGLGYDKEKDAERQRDSKANPILKMSDISDTFHSDLLEAYDNSNFYRPMFTPCVGRDLQKEVKKMAYDRNMKVDHSRSNGITISKNVEIYSLFTQCFNAGGKLDLYCLIPPQEEVDGSPSDLTFMNNLDVEQLLKNNKAERGGKELVKNGKNNKAGRGGKVNQVSKVSEKAQSKSVQCNMVNLPKLDRLNPKNESCKLIYELDSSGSGSDDDDDEEHCSAESAISLGRKRRREEID